MFKEHKIRYVIIGWYCIGKTSMAEYYTKNKEADSKYKFTIGIEFFEKIIVYQKKKLFIQIWDTAGKEQFKYIVTSYYRQPCGAFLCFDITNRESFEKLEYYLYKLLSINENNVHIILVGTFLDKNDTRTVTYKEAMKFAKKHKLQYMEISSKNGENIDECFNTMHNIMCERIDKQDKEIDTNTYTDININLFDDKYKKNCCKL